MVGTHISNTKFECICNQICKVTFNEKYSLVRLLKKPVANMLYCRKYFGNVPEINKPVGAVHSVGISHTVHVQTGSTFKCICRWDEWILL